MKKAISRSLKLLIAVVAIVVVAVVILLVIKPNQVKPLEGYSRVSIYRTATDRIDLDTAEESDKAHLDTLNKGLKQSRYNVMHGILEWKANASLKLGTREAVDEDGETYDEWDTTKAAAFNPSLGEGEYKLLFFFDEVRSVKIGSETVKYDRAIVFVHDSENEIDKVAVYFYEDARMNNESDDPAISSAYYEIHRVEMRIIATRLYEATGNIIEEKRG